jgi:hypothetical protein
MPSRYSSTDDEKNGYTNGEHEHVVSREIDTAAELAAGSDKPLDPTEALRLRYCTSNI